MPAPTLAYPAGSQPAAPKLASPPRVYQRSRHQSRRAMPRSLVHTDVSDYAWPQADRGNRLNPASASPKPWQNPHSACGTPLHTFRDFVPWRFLDAGRNTAWVASTSRRPKTCTRAVVRTPATHFPCASGTDIRIPLYTSFIPSHALCIRSYNRAAERDFHTRGRDETNAHPCGHPVAWRVCHRSRAGEFVGRYATESSGQCRDQRAGQLAGQHGVQCCCARGGALSIRRIAERQSDGVRLRVRSSRRPHLSVSGSRGYSGDNGTSRQHRHQRANRHVQRHVGRCWCWRRCLIERGLPGRDTVNGRQRRRRRSLRRHRPMLAAFSYSAAASSKSGARPDTKHARIIAMLRKPAGATVAAIMAATDWQQHSVRGFLAGVVRKKLGLNLVSDQTDKGRVYRIKDGRPSPASADRAQQAA